MAVLELAQASPDGDWVVVPPMLPVPGWLQGRGGQLEAYGHRAMLDAIRY